jgi:hypothetical protein
LRVNEDYRAEKIAGLFYLFLIVSANIWTDFRLQLAVLRMPRMFGWDCRRSSDSCSRKKYRLSDKNGVVRVRAHHLYYTAPGEVSPRAPAFIKHTNRSFHLDSVPEFQKPYISQHTWLKPSPMGTVKHSCTPPQLPAL